MAKSACNLLGLSEKEVSQAIATPFLHDILQAKWVKFKRIQKTDLALPMEI